MDTANRTAFLLVLAGVLIGRFAVRPSLAEDAEDRIRPYAENPFYWQYKGEPVLLLGGSDDDNLFQWTGAKLTEHLDLLESAGGNYLRNTMSSRDPGNVWPYLKRRGEYDLNQFNDEFWRRFEVFLRETERREIIVQIEIWATWDYYDAQWEVNPFNPKNNVNYTSKESGLPERLFGELAKNNHQKGQQHYDNALRRRISIRNNRRPLTNVKIYGGEYRRFGDARDGVERFWRNIFGGHAAVRFHRPNGGIGLNSTSQQMIRAARQVTDALDIFCCEPRNDLLSHREPNEAYCLAEDAKQFAVYFPGEGSVTLDTSSAKTARTLRWYSIDRCRWHSTDTVGSGESVILTTPGTGQWAVVIVAQ